MELFSASTPGLDSRIDEILDGSGIPGAAITIVNGDRKTMKVHGVCRGDGGQTITPNTAFDLGSCSKSFVATAMVFLADQGKLKEALGA